WEVEFGIDRFIAKKNDILNFLNGPVPARIQSELQTFTVNWGLTYGELPEVAGIEYNQNHYKYVGETVCQPNDPRLHLWALSATISFVNREKQASLHFNNHVLSGDPCREGFDPEVGYSLGVPNK